MSWQDDPIVAPPSTGSNDWQNDPVVAAPSKLESFARGAGNNFPLAPQAIAGGEALLGDKGYSENLADWNQKAADAKKANPVSYGAGAVTGAVAPLLIPGVGEALEAAPLAGNAVLGAANAISNKDLSKDPLGTVEEAGKGAAFGAGTAAALGKVGGMFSSVGDRLEANSTSQALDLNARSITRMARGLHDPEETMLGVNKEMNELMPGIIGPMDTAASKFNKLLAAHDAAGKDLGQVVDSVSGAYGNKIPEATEAISELKAAANKYKGHGADFDVQAKAALDDLAMDLTKAQKAGTLDFRGLADFKTSLGQAYHNPNMDNRGIDQAYAILSQKIDQLLDRVTVEDPTLKPAYDKAKQIYKLTSNVLPAMQKGVGREVAGKSGGLTNAALGAGAVFGHPLAAGVTYAAKTAAHLVAPDLAPNLTYKGINALRNGWLQNLPIKQGITQEMADFLESKYGRNNNGQ